MLPVLLPKESNMPYTSTPANDRHGEIFRLPLEQHPESRDLLFEIDTLEGEIHGEIEERAVASHGRQILAMIDGTLWEADGLAEREAEKSPVVRLVTQDEVSA
jgi:hypothetical protein